MIIRTLRSLAFMLGMLLSMQINAQVTIGYGNAPLPGSLLQLKENESTANNSIRGLGMPRVELSEQYKLKMGDVEILDTDNDGDQYSKHIGLMVYNISETSPFCPGLYTWSGTKWQRLQDACFSILLDRTGPLYFASGQDLRTITGQTVTATWDPATATAYWSNAANGSFSQVNFTNTGAFSPDVPWTTTPATITITPDAMTGDDVDPTKTGGSFFRTKESKLNFTVAKDGKTATTAIIVNQTNKALSIDNTLIPDNINEPANNTAKTHNIESNARWKLSAMEPNDATNTFTGISIGGSAATIGEVLGSELTDGTANSFNLAYTIATGASMSRFSKLIFSDAETSKRFNDVILSIYQCSNTGKAPNLSEWAAIAGFAGVAETKISDEDDIAKGIDTPNPDTGIAWHRDQDGNVFLSANFQEDDITGNGQRWMINNLAAKKYSPNVTHAGERDLNGPDGNADNHYDVAYWAYPKSTNDPAEFYNNPRLGLLYTWDAATAGKGGNAGNVAVAGELESATTPDIDPQATRVQGICPDGWHLPSDREWTWLEQEINANTTTYSSESSPANGTITVGNTGWRGSTHGRAMKDECENYSGTHRGTSNPVSTIERPGFKVMFPGYISSSNDQVVSFSQETYFWTSSSGTSGTTAAVRQLRYDYSMVQRLNNRLRHQSFSVRCKKDS